MNEKTTRLTTYLLVGLVVLSVISIGFAIPSGSVAAASSPEHTDDVCYGYVCEEDPWCGIEHNRCHACDDLCEHPGGQLYCRTGAWYCSNCGC